MKYIVEIDTKHVSVYRGGLILKQPSFVVMKKGFERPVATGEKCFSLVGSLPEDTSIINPIQAGAIANRQAATAMLKDFFERVIEKSKFKNVEIIAPISAGLSMAERENFENALIKTGYHKIELIESIMGLVPYADKKGQAVIYIGHGTAEIGVVSQQGIISACSVDLGCDAIEKKIAEIIADRFNMKISQSSVEAVRKELATLRANDESCVEIVGRDMLSHQTKRFSVRAKDIRPAVEKCYNLILEIAESLITTIPFKLIQPVTDKGVYIAGAGANIPGLASHVKNVFGLNVTIPNEPETAVLRGLFSAENQ